MDSLTSAKRSARIAEIEVGCCSNLSDSIRRIKTRSSPKTFISIGWVVVEFSIHLILKFLLSSTFWTITFAQNVSCCSTEFWCENAVNISKICRYHISSGSRSIHNATTAILIQHRGDRQGNINFAISPNTPEPALSPTPSPLRNWVAIYQVRNAGTRQRHKRWFWFKDWNPGVEKRCIVPQVFQVVAFIYFEQLITAALLLDVGLSRERGRLRPRTQASPCFFDFARTEPTPAAPAAPQAPGHGTKGIRRVHITRSEVDFIRYMYSFVRDWMDRQLGAWRPNLWKSSPESKHLGVTGRKEVLNPEHFLFLGTKSLLSDEWKWIKSWNYFWINSIKSIVSNHMKLCAVFRILKKRFTWIRFIVNWWKKKERNKRKRRRTEMKCENLKSVGPGNRFLMLPLKCTQIQQNSAEGLS